MIEFRPGWKRSGLGGGVLIPSGVVRELNGRGAVQSAIGRYACTGGGLEKMRTETRESRKPGRPRAMAEKPRRVLPPCRMAQPEEGEVVEDSHKTKWGRGEEYYSSPGKVRGKCAVGTIREGERGGAGACLHHYSEVLRKSREL